MTLLCLHRHLSSRNVSCGHLVVLHRLQTMVHVSRSVEAAGLSEKLIGRDRLLMILRWRSVGRHLRVIGAALIMTAAVQTSELNLADYFHANKLNYEEVTLASEPEVVAAYDEGRCDVVTSDVSRLHAERLQIKSPDDHVILPDTISKEPLGPAVRDGDDHWLDLVKWTHFAMINAEELGVTQKTLPLAMESDRAKIRRLLGSYAALGEVLGLSNDWAARIIRHVGNYGEVFERNLGSASKLAIPRGLSRLWTDGGLQYAPPMR